jgi:hypothetical protein
MYGKRQPRSEIFVAGTAYLTYWLFSYLTTLLRFNRFYSYYWERLILKEVVVAYFKVRFWIFLGVTGKTAQNLI